MRRDIQCVHLFADQLGASHFAKVRTELLPANFAPPAPPLLVSAPFEAVRFGIAIATEKFPPLTLAGPLA